MAWEPLSDDQLEIRELVRTLARERVAPRAAEIDASHEFPWDVVDLYREHEVFGLFFDEPYGGTGTGTLLSLIAIEEVSKVCATSGSSSRYRIWARSDSRSRAPTSSRRSRRTCCGFCEACRPSASS